MSLGKPSFKNQGKWQFGEQEALAGGGYVSQRLRSVVIIYQPKQHHIIATTITCWSVICQVRPISLLSPAECGTGANEPYEP